MFGYVLPVKGEMKIREFEQYRAVYCGVCKQLGKNFGTGSRFLLNYDLVLLALLADGVSGEAGNVRCENCFANPLAKRHTLHGTSGLMLAADGLIMLSYHKLLDNIHDEKLVKRTLYRLAHPYSSHLYRKAQKRNPALDTLLKEQMERQVEIEQARCTSLDEAADPTAQMCAALFEKAAQTQIQKPLLKRLGLFCGQIVYILDAAEDYAEDKTNNRYNVFVQAGMDFQQAVATAKSRCRMAAGEVAKCYHQIELKQYKPILDNVFYLGLPAGIENAGSKRNQRRPSHGQIQSL